MSTKGQACEFVYILSTSKKACLLIASVRKITNFDYLLLLRKLTLTYLALVAAPNGASMQLPGLVAELLGPLGCGDFEKM